MTQTLEGGHLQVYGIHCLGMTKTQERIYKLIKKGKIMNVSDMARSLGITRQHFTEQLNKLKEKGLVVEQPRFIVRD